MTDYGRNLIHCFTEFINVPVPPQPEYAPTLGYTAIDSCDPIMIKPLQFSMWFFWCFRFKFLTTDVASLGLPQHLKCNLYWQLNQFCRVPWVLLPLLSLHLCWPSPNYQRKYYLTLVFKYSSPKATDVLLGIIWQMSPQFVKK